jgi:hypothetical protein
MAIKRLAGFRAKKDREKVAKDEQERIRSSLLMKFIPPPVGIGGRTGYTPELGTELCIMRRNGKSRYRICQETGLTDHTVRGWLEDFPEFSQEWSAAYSDYITAEAEDIIPRVKNLVEGLKLDGKKLSAKQEGRYIRRLELLHQEVHWAATRRVPELYGDKDGGNQLVLVQMTEPARTVSQDPDSALKWRKELEDGSAGMPPALGADGSIGAHGGADGGDRAERDEVPQGDTRPHVVRRYKRGGRLMVKPSK